MHIPQEIISTKTSQAKKNVRGLYICFVLHTQANVRPDVVDEHARVLEEQWIDSMDNAGTASLSSSSSPSILHGIVLGFFFPLLPLFFFHQSKPAVFWDDGSEQDTMGTMVFS